MLKESKAFSGFSVDDIPAAMRFYGETLGLDASEQGGGMGLQLATGGSVFIYPKDDHEPAAYTALNFPVDDLEATVDALVERGVTFERYDGFEQDERGIADTPGGGPRIAWFKDPAGNVLSVLST
jgi:predicted enzyme related to lactoylglutathione lyase